MASSAGDADSALRQYKHRDTLPANAIDSRFRVLTRIVSRTDSSALPDQRDGAALGEHRRRADNLRTAGIAVPVVVVAAANALPGRWTLLGRAASVVAAGVAALATSNMLVEGERARFAVATARRRGSLLGAETRRWLAVGRPDLLRASGGVF
jgi:hypothetical protein